MQINYYLLIFCVILSYNCLSLVDSHLTPPKAEHREKLEECRTCKILIDSFNHWVDKTSRGKFEGGDADWEETKLKSYARSEIRLIEIQEGICSELKKHKDDCYFLAEEAEQLIEQWWFKRDVGSTDLYSWLCIETLSHCCPAEHFGEACTPCVRGTNSEICSGRGTCKGEGTRKGDGKCKCHRGFAGEVCDNCANNYFAAVSEMEKLICEACDRSCADGCTSKGPAGCRSCRSGWEMGVTGCQDVNECNTSHTCTDRQFCINVEGSHKCRDCNESCESCKGESSSECLKCADGYEPWLDACVNSELRDALWRKSAQRLFLYLGLLVSLMFVYRRNKALATLFVVVIAVFIFYSEYVVNNDGLLRKLLHLFTKKVLI